MVLEKAHKETGREVEHAGRLSRPDRCSHGQDVVIAKLATVAAGSEVVTQADLIPVFQQQFWSFAVEAKNVV